MSPGGKEDCNGGGRGGDDITHNVELDGSVGDTSLATCCSIRILVPTLERTLKNISLSIATVSRFNFLYSDHHSLDAYSDNLGMRYSITVATNWLTYKLVSENDIF